MKRAVTLLEMMVVLLLIGIVTSVVGYNVRGSLAQGKAFKTQEAARKLYSILLLEETRGNALEEDFSNMPTLLQQSGLVVKVSDITNDGWGNPFVLFRTPEGHVRFSSVKYEQYCQEKGQQPQYPWDD